MVRVCLLLIVAAAYASGARAADLRDYCPDRPGLGTPACIIDKGHASLEVGLLEWSRSDADGAREDDLVAGDMLLRLGVSQTTEVQLGFTSYGRVRMRDASGKVEKQSHPGDVTLALRHNLRNPDGSGTSVALMPWLTLPVGQQPVGAGDWSAGLTVPASVELSDRVSLELVPQIAAAVNGDGHGRHLAYGGVIGIAAQASEKLAATLEYQIERDNDPEAHSSSQVVGLSFGWMVRDGLQLDAGGNLNLAVPGTAFTLYCGVARRF